MIDHNFLMYVISKTRGWKYQEKGEEPGAVDCVGWVVYILKSCGYDLPNYHRPNGNDAALFYRDYHNYLEPVEIKDIAPGVVVFFPNGLEGGHLALYVGGGLIAHCTRKHGVIFQGLNTQPLNRLKAEFYRVKHHGQLKDLHHSKPDEPRRPD